MARIFVEAVKFEESAFFPREDSPGYTWICDYFVCPRFRSPYHDAF